MTDENSRSRALTRQEFEAVMKRATELAASDPDSMDESTMDEAELLRIAQEVGIADKHVRRALVELRSADTPSGLVDRWYGTSKVRVSRSVPGTRKEIAATLDEYLVAGHLMQPVRRSPEYMLYRPAVDWLSNFARAGASMTVTVYWASAKEFEVRLQEIDEETTVVEFTVEPGIRGEYISGGIIGGLSAGGAAGFFTGLGLSAVGIASGGMLPIAIAVGGLTAGGVAWSTGHAARKKRAHVKQELEGILDALERGDELNPPPASWKRWVKRQADRFKVDLFGSGNDKTDE